MIDDQLSTLTDVCDRVRPVVETNEYQEEVVTGEAVKAGVRCRFDSGARLRTLKAGESSDQTRTIVQLSARFRVAPGEDVLLSDLLRYKGVTYQVTGLPPIGTNEVLQAVDVERAG